MVNSGKYLPFSLLPTPQLMNSSQRGLGATNIPKKIIIIITIIRIVWSYSSDLAYRKTLLEYIDIFPDEHITQRHEKYLKQGSITIIDQI